jgi:hypothetical protein
VRGAVWSALLWLACAPRSSTTTVADNTGAGLDPVITLDRTACFGQCPVYHLSVAPDGTVLYQGSAHVPHLGPATGRIPPERVEALLSEIERAGYFSFAPRYTPAEPACGRYSTDSPSAITTVRVRARTKRIEHDYGCGASPGALTVLERRIDEVLGSGQWTGR